MFKKPRFYIFLALGLSVLYFGGVQALKYRLHRYLKKQEKQGIFVDHEGLRLQLLEGSARFHRPKVSLTSAARLGYSGEMAFATINIQDMDYWRLLWNGDLTIEYISLHQNKAHLKTEPKAASSVKNDSLSDPEIGFAINLKYLLLEGLDLEVTDGKTNERLLSLQNFNLDISDMEVSDRTLARSIPFVGQDYILASDSVFIKATPYENLQLAQISGTDKKTTIKGIRFKTELPIAEYDRQLQQERDHYDIAIAAIELWELGMENGENDQILLSSKHIHITRAQAAIYRNKLLPDEGKVKPLYGTLLRNAPMAISIDSLSLDAVDFVYSEKSKKGRDTGVLEFQDLKVRMERLGNTYSKETNIHMETNFMGAAPLEAKWAFKVQQLEDSFTFEGALHGFPLHHINGFTAPYADTEVSGTMNSLYFTIYGNPQSATMDIRSQYEDVQVYLLNSDTHKRKKWVSALVNIFVSSHSKTTSRNFDKASVTVARDSTKSPWNYIYKNLEEGLKKLLLVVHPW